MVRLYQTVQSFTLDSSIGKIDLVDLDPKQPGIQVFVEGGTYLFQFRQLKPVKEHYQLKVVSSTQAHLFALPDLRPIIAVGMIEGSLISKSLTLKN